MIVQKNFNEGHFAKKIAKHLGTNHTEISISEDHIFNFIKDIPKVYSEPFAGFISNSNNNSLFYG